MKKLILMMVMAITAITASAEVEEGFAMGVRADVGMSNVTEGGSAGFSYGIGWIAEYNFSNNFYLQSGVGLQNLAHDSENAFYAQVPIHVGYRFPVGENSIFVQLGPSIGCGLFGSDSYFEYNDRFEFGMSSRVGYEFKSFQISLGGYFGLTGESHNVCSTIGVAYMF